ncbi:hydroxyacid dehydrogenase [Protaetiibacter intestinalis]|uniref:Hydroxyacid dehydrogenase n=2 Tax=Protaetiibacter intestinalis TaxID=2419774 RepID=A0A387BF24_9MICO|nr:hydroxyacid dehydrogenase [Protaetiibacter intestinalis]
MRTRLAPQLGDTAATVWTLGTDAPFPGPADLLVLPYMIPAAELGRLNGLPVALVQSQTLGYDGVAEHLPAGITYCNALEVHESSTAELALALTLAALRGIPAAVRDAAEGRWAHRRRPGLAGKRVVLVGVGGVGAEISRRLEPFGVELVRVARTARADVHGIDELPALLPDADVAIVAVPLTAETRHLVDARLLAALPDGALLVNVSRGEIVDTDALLGELTRGRIVAALDVTDPEPLPPGHPLWTAPGVLITPHLGGDTDAMDARIDRVVLEQLRRLRAGEPPLNLVFDADRADA